MFVYELSGCGFESSCNKLSVCWGKLTNNELILNPAKNVRIAQNELTIDFMDQKAFGKGETVDSSNPVKEKACFVTESPLNARHGPAVY